MEYLDGRAVLWASDLPHFDCEDEGSPRRLTTDNQLSEAYRRRVLADNAIEFFDLKIKRPS